MFLLQLCDDDYMIAAGRNIDNNSTPCLTMTMTYDCDFEHVMTMTVTYDCEFDHEHV